jgi:glycosyltransferase involved in cell wall biosynthesis
MKYLFLHQNFPAQFRVIAEALAADKGNEVLALCQHRRPSTLANVGVATYRFLREPLANQHPLLQEMEAKVLRAEAVAEACRNLRKKGWTPDVVVAHPGWGESMLIREVWPQVRLVSYVEYFYAAEGQDFNFDPEFTVHDESVLAKLRLKNTVNLHALNDSDALWTATEFQRNTFPAWARERIQVIHEGVDMEALKPNPKASITIAGKNLVLTAADEVVTYASRSLEPLRGFHVFMRALPALLKARPKAHVVIMGKEETTYGAPPRGHASWLQQLIKEVGPQLDPARVHLVGFLPPEIYRAVLQISRAHVYLTYPFVLSWSAVEALSSGARLVAADTGPVREILPPGSDPYVFDFFDAKALVAATCRALARTPAQIAADAKDARAVVKANYLAAKQVEALKTLFTVGKKTAAKTHATTKAPAAAKTAPRAANAPAAKSKRKAAPAKAKAKASAQLARKTKAKA